MKAVLWGVGIFVLAFILDGMRLVFFGHDVNFLITAIWGGVLGFAAWWREARGG